MTDQRSFPIRSRTLDRIEQIIAVTFFAALILRLWPAGLGAASPVTFLLLFSEGIVILFLLLRRTTDQISTSPTDWLIAAGGTISALLVGKIGVPLAPQLGSVFIMFGTFVQLSAKLNLRRSFGLVAANRGVRSSGLYAFLRHPMYAGYMLIHVGYFIAGPTWRNFLVYVVTWAFLIARIFAEERILKQDPAYCAFMKRVRFRLVPGVF